ncbi:MAG TPA: DUF3810 domain-containing protein [Planctomycetota bacterium]|nr:DUF3810 domain-containing protein [Planctomycetota bacterium]
MIEAPPAVVVPPRAPAKPRDRAVPMRAWAAVLGTSAVALVALQALGRSAERVESWYAGAWSPAAGRAIAAITGRVGVSVGELLLLAAALGALVLSARAALDVLRGARRAANALARGLAFGTGAAALLLVAFYALWGLNYKRPDIVRRLALERYDEGPERDPTELERLCASLAAGVNRDYELATGGRDAGAPSAPSLPVSEIDRRIDAGYERVAARLSLGDAFAASRGPAKPVLFSMGMSYAGIAGIYDPFTAEANYNRDLPACTIPEVIGHEKAHQRGIASEDEANFMSFLACVASDDPYTRYSAYAFSLGQLSGDLRRADPAAVDRVRARLDPGPLRDYAERDRFWRRYEGVVERVGAKVNDTYLRANGDRRGIAAYGYSTRLLVLFARAHGGSVEAFLNPENAPRVP